MTRRTRLFGWTVSLGLIASTAQAVDVKYIEGNATWNESDSVPRGSMLIVELVDLTRARDGTVLSSMHFKPEAGTPLPFVLHYDEDLIQRGQSYSLIARLVKGDDVLFRSTIPVPVLRTYQPERPQITMEKVAPIVAADTPVGLSWNIVSIGGLPPLGYTPMFFDLNEDGTVEGDFGCNTFKGAYAIDGQKLEFNRVQATNAGCTTAIANQERAARSALRRTVGYLRSGEELRFVDVAGLETLRMEQR